MPVEIRPPLVETTRPTVGLAFLEVDTGDIFSPITFGTATAVLVEGAPPTTYLGQTLATSPLVALLTGHGRTFVVAAVPPRPARTGRRPATVDGVLLETADRTDDTLPAFLRRRPSPAPRLPVETTGRPASPPLVAAKTAPPTVVTSGPVNLPHIMVRPPRPAVPRPPRGVDPRHWRVRDGDRTKQILLSKNGLFSTVCVSGTILNSHAFPAYTRKRRFALNTVYRYYPSLYVWRRVSLARVDVPRGRPEQSTAGPRRPLCSACVASQWRGFRRPLFVKIGNVKPTMVPRQNVSEQGKPYPDKNKNADGRGDGIVVFLTARLRFLLTPLFWIRYLAKLT